MNTKTNNDNKLPTSDPKTELSDLEFYQQEVAKWEQEMKAKCKVLHEAADPVFATRRSRGQYAAIADVMGALDLAYGRWAIESLSVLGTARNVLGGLAEGADCEELVDWGFSPEEIASAAHAALAAVDYAEGAIEQRRDREKFATLWQLSGPEIGPVEGRATSSEGPDLL